MKTSIAALIKTMTRFPSSAPVICRGEEEAEFLRRFVAGKTDVSLPAAEPSASSNFPDAASCTECAGSAEYRESTGECAFGLMVILNTPTLMSRMERAAFSEEARTMLKNIIEKAVGIDYFKCYVTEMIKCAVFESTMPVSRVFENCINHLRREISENDPKVILVMGEMIQLKKLMNENKGISWFNIDHPLVLAKNKDLKANAWKTIKLLNEKMLSLGLK